ncbi:MAG: dihydrodipicolinate synthase family protein, partial [Flavobacteriales bacterium]
MVTPFQKNRELDLNALKTLTEHLLNNDVDFLVVQGTTGETPVLDEDE